MRDINGGKKGVTMKCSKCMLYGHNKKTCKTNDEEINERQREAAEAKKAQSKAARAHAATKVRFQYAFEYLMFLVNVLMHVALNICRGRR